MSQREIDDRLQAARRFARDAGNLVMRYFAEGVPADRKADDSPVTRADREAEWLLREAIQKAFPGDGVLGEEHGEIEGTSPYRWILDPIDGTKSFISGVPLFGTLIGVQRDGESVLGVIELPALDKRIHAATGQGAWWQEGMGELRRAHVSTTPTLADGFYVTSEVRSFQKRSASIVHQQLEEASWYARTWGDCYGYFLVATGRATVMVDPALHVWDAAALLPVITEAGGAYTDWAGEPSTTSGDGVGSNGLVHAEVLAITRPFARRPHLH
jgi:histidinol phosphatase-like enzyme (inositol monophosphatase family)